MLCKTGKMYGYNTNCDKPSLLVKPGLVDEASDIFKGTSVQIRERVAQYLGSAIGEADFVKEFVWERIKELMRELKMLAL